ncbi:alkaline phosphatase [Salicibibacter halophilus]|uniref:alkaline phosphatase n=1 Tax=Salicibibacter halophilus TaxID=2502791 RepID=UPI0013575C32|nr:alkaline phosphatase [Salicibibacter halophilus]
MTVVIPFIFGTAIYSAGGEDEINSENSESEEKITDTADNIILLIGDGMALQQTSTAAYYLGEGASDGEQSMDTMPHTGFVRTHSNDNVITDSAAAATAMASGYKTDDNVVGMVPSEDGNEDYEEVKTILSYAQDENKSTGLVTNTTMTHATPASFAAHVEDRGMEEEIAPQMLDSKVDILFGGGIEFFLPEEEGGEREDGRNLIEEAEADGYELLHDQDDLSESSSDQLLGLFSEDHMSFELDRETTNEPSLSEMTDTAIENLSQNDDGFFLMIEGGRIDHAGHSNYPVANITDTIAFDHALQVALDYAQEDPNTLVVVTADHGTGGMSAGVDGEYDFNRDVISDVTRSSEYMANEMNDDNSNIEEVLAEYAGIQDLTSEEIEMIENADDADEGVAHVISQRAGIGWTTTGHTAVDVPVYAYGSHAEAFSGTLDNTDIANNILDAMSEENDELPESAVDIKAVVENLAEDGEIADEETSRALTVHLTAVHHHENQDAAEQVVQHMEGFQDLLDQQHNDALISEEAYEILSGQAEDLLDEWE